MTRSAGRAFARPREGTEHAARARDDASLAEQLDFLRAWQRRFHDAGYVGLRWPQAFLWSCAGAIAGGTSEVQANIIAQRILGLPR